MNLKTILLRLKSKINVNTDESLTYRIVMKRIVKRFLMHSLSEVSPVVVNPLDELKQDLQMIRNEVKSDFRKSKEESLTHFSTLKAGVSVINEELQIIKNSANNPMQCSTLVEVEVDSKE
jgi:hypothetical protein